MRRPSLLRVSTWILFIAGFAALVVAFRSSFAQAIDEIAFVRRGLLSLALVVLIIGRGVLPLIAWMNAARVLAGMQGHDAARAWLRSLVAKYIPGGVWQPVSAIGHLKTGGGSTTSAGSVVLFDICAAVIGGLIVGLVAVPGLVLADSRSALWLLIAIPMLALLHPTVFESALRLARKLMGRTAIQLPRLEGSLVLTNVSLHAIGWALAGVSLGLVFRALDAPISWTAVVPAASLSWVIGLLVLIAPAGIGIRELALVLLLNGVAPQDSIIAAAVISRLMFLGVDIGGAAASIFIREEGVAGG